MLHSQGQLTDHEFAWESLTAITDIDDYEAVSDGDMKALLDACCNLPDPVKEILVEMLEYRIETGFPVMKGMGFRMPPEEQEARMPYVRVVTEGLLDRLESNQPTQTMEG